MRIYFEIKEFMNLYINEQQCIINGLDLKIKFD